MDNKCKHGPNPSPLAPRIIALALSGMAPCDIAAKLACKAPAVYHQIQTARKRGVIVPYYKRGSKPGSMRGKTPRIVAMVKSGMLPSDIAAAVGCKVDAVRHQLRKARERLGLAPCHTCGPKPGSMRGKNVRPETKQMIALALEGLSPATIAARLGRNPVTVESVIYRARAGGLVIPKHNRGQKVWSPLRRAAQQKKLLQRWLDAEKASALSA